MEIAPVETYLKTKLIHPQVRPQRVPRPRLLQRLPAALQVPLTLVCAPAGYGKTTLLVEWARASQVPVAWLTLDAEDNDPQRFLSYFILALQRLDPELGRSAQAPLKLAGAGLLDS